MKECNDCHKIIKEEDKYCHNCGCKILKNYQITIINIIKILLIICIVITIIMFILSYFI